MLCGVDIVVVLTGEDRVDSVEDWGGCSVLVLGAELMTVVDGWVVVLALVVVELGTDSIVSDCCTSTVEVWTSTTTEIVVKVVAAFVTALTTVGAATVMVVVAILVPVVVPLVTVTVEASCLAKSFNGASGCGSNGLALRFLISRASMVIDTVATDVEVLVEEIYAVPA